MRIVKTETFMGQQVEVDPVEFPGLELQNQTWIRTAPGKWLRADYVFYTQDVEALEQAYQKFLHNT